MILTYFDFVSRGRAKTVPLRGAIKGGKIVPASRTPRQPTSATSLKEGNEIREQGCFRSPNATPLEEGIWWRKHPASKNRRSFRQPQWDET